MGEIMRKIPKKPGQTRTHTVTYRATSKQHEALIKEKEKRGFTVSHIIELGLKKVIKDYP